MVFSASGLQGDRKEGNVSTDCFVFHSSHFLPTVMPYWGETWGSLILKGYHLPKIEGQGLDLSPFPLCSFPIHLLHPILSQACISKIHAGIPGYLDGFLSNVLCKSLALGLPAAIPLNNSDLGHFLPDTSVNLG